MDRAEYREHARHHGERPGPAGGCLGETGEQPRAENARQSGQQDEGEQPRRERAHGGVGDRFRRGVRGHVHAGVVGAVVWHPGVHLLRQGEDVPVPEAGGGAVRHPVRLQRGGDIQRVDGTDTEVAVAVHERLDRVPTGVVPRGLRPPRAALGTLSGAALGALADAAPPVSRSGCEVPGRHSGSRGVRAVIRLVRPSEGGPCRVAGHVDRARGVVCGHGGVLPEVPLRPGRGGGRGGTLRLSCAHPAASPLAPATGPAGGTAKAAAPGYVGDAARSDRMPGAGTPACASDAEGSGHAGECGAWRHVAGAEVPVPTTGVRAPRRAVAVGTPEGAAVAATPADPAGAGMPTDPAGAGMPADPAGAGMLAGPGAPARRGARWVLERRGV